MNAITVSVHEAVLRKARQYADEHDTTLEALLAEHVRVLADRAGRGLTAREQIYVDCEPSEDVKEALRADFAGDKQKAR